MEDELNDLLTQARDNIRDNVEFNSITFEVEEEE